MNQSVEQVLSHIRIVLENPKDGRNIGSVCRAMKSMGLADLCIAGSLPENRDLAEITAVHAEDLLGSIRVFPDLQSALTGCSLILGTSRRRGSKRKYFSFSPEEAAQRLVKAGSAAIVFGNETSGLSDADLRLCHGVIAIPTSEVCPSLNLSHAVQIMAYTLLRQARSMLPDSRYEPIDDTELNSLVKTISSSLGSIGFFKLVKSNDMEVFWRDILARSGLSAKEAKRVGKVFEKIQGLFKKVKKE